MIIEYDLELDKETSEKVGIYYNENYPTWVKLEVLYNDDIKVILLNGNRETDITEYLTDHDIRRIYALTN